MSTATRQAYIEAVLFKSGPILGSFPFAATIADPEQEDCPLVWANDHFCKLTQYRSDEVIGKNCRFLQGSLDVETEELKISIDMRKSVTINITNVKKNGERFQNLLHVNCLKLFNSHIFVGSQEENRTFFKRSDYYDRLAKSEKTNIKQSRKAILDSWCILLKNHINKIKI